MSASEKGAPEAPRGKIEGLRPQYMIEDEVQVLRDAAHKRVFGSLDEEKDQ